MYLQYDKQEAVKAVQKFLRKIYEDKYPIPISGYFDSVTKKATEKTPKNAVFKKKSDLQNQP